jgi:type I restriction enzyme S subunit
VDQNNSDMKWERVELGTLVEKVKKCLPEKETPNTNIKYVDISSIDRISKSVDRHSIQSILGTEAPSRARQVLKPDDILVSTVRPNLNAVAAIPDSLDGSIGSTGFSVLRPLHGKLLSKYLLYFVQSEYFINQLMQRATGASYPAVSDKIVKETQIPLPPLPEQRRLAARLDKADAVRQKSRALVEAYAELGRSVFLEVFGDPVRNERGWEVVELKDALEKIQIGPFGSQLHKSDYVNDGVPLINPKHINDLTVEPETSVSITTKKYNNLPQYHLERNDVIMARRGEMGRCARIEESRKYFCGTGSLFIRPNPKLIDSIYLTYLLSSSSIVEYLENKGAVVICPLIRMKIHT